MARFKLDLRGDAFQRVLGFTFSHWKKQPIRVTVVGACFLLATVADVLTPLYAGQLVDAVTQGAASDAVAWNAALTAFGLLMALGFGAALLRHTGYMQIIAMTLNMMQAIVGDAFRRVQRFSTDWHANAFAGSTVRKITRGMWGIASLTDQLIMMLMPSAVMLIGTTIMLSLLWPVMGLIVGLGSLIYVAVTVALSIGFV
ncbi:MAG: ABC transporter transmembrane domain-containing protein, partial [Devosia sp.]